METMKTTREAAIRLASLLRDHKAADVVLLDVTGQSTWADYFVIGTVTSTAHSKGLQRHVGEELSDIGLAVHRTKTKIPDGDEWNLIDLDSVVVHLMTEAARSFYDLERLWYESPKIAF